MWLIARMAKSIAKVVKCAAACVLLAALNFTPVHAQEAGEDQTITIATDERTDDAIRDRLTQIYSQFDGLSRLQVRVDQGVVTLQGVTFDRISAEQAVSIAHRVEGVVAVQDKTQSSVDVGERASPLIERLHGMAISARDAAPLLIVAIAIVGVIGMSGGWVASRRQLWRRLLPNPFIADLAAQAVRVGSFVVGVAVALNFVGAGALLGAVLGGAGVLGLAIGFAVRDSLENYISSIMLSLRQPFRANDHVVIDGHEGKVVRLTSRATVLMTLEGNHLRIPNATVFKAVILNYTRNPERRFSFTLGIDSNDDARSAIEVGVASLLRLDFVLADPAPNGMIESVGDSNVVLRFTGWVDQMRADFLKARSLAIWTTKAGLEAAGFTLPEPIYRLRIDQFASAAIPDAEMETSKPRGAVRARAPTGAMDAAVVPEDYLDHKIAAERRETKDEDLLNPSRPIE